MELTRAGCQILGDLICIGSYNTNQQNGNITAGPDTWLLKPV